MVGCRAGGEQDRSQGGRTCTGDRHHPALGVTTQADPSEARNLGRDLRVVIVGLGGHADGYRYQLAVNLLGEGGGTFKGDDAARHPFVGPIRHDAPRCQYLQLIAVYFE